MSTDIKFTAQITRDKNSGWTCVEWPESVGVLGTGTAVKVTVAIAGHDFQATFLPTGGKHMLPLRAAVLKATSRNVGDTVEVHVKNRD